MEDMTKEMNNLKKTMLSDKNDILTVIRKTGEKINEVCKEEVAEVPKPEYTCTCGIERTPKIVGGEDVPRGKYPWIAYLVKWKDSVNSNIKPNHCGATLINSRWAITAAHCISIYEPVTAIVLGDKLDPVLEWKYVKVEAAIAHKYYVPDIEPKMNDIALLKLAEEVDLDVYTPACLPEPDKDYTGWGLTDLCNPAPTKILQEITLEILSLESCKKASGNYTYWDEDNHVCKNRTVNYDDLVNDLMLCAGTACKKGQCFGDSGGPITVKEDGKHYLAGVVSWGVGSNEENEFPGVYARVAHQLNRFWIDEVINKWDLGLSTYCPK